ncbi:MAG: hypothetical protein Kow00121_58810 [Elainellaceae cyanobacterium]
MLRKEHKVDAILNAWLEYVQLDDLSKLEIPSKDVKYDGITLSGNMLRLEEKLFAKLQDSQRQKRQGNQLLPWVVSFPQIYRPANNSSVFYPLFSLDITSIFQGGYQAQGWSIEEFAIAEAGNNLARFLNLDEEQIKQLVTKDGLRRFLETTFDIEFESLEDWMRHLEKQMRQMTNFQIYRLIKRPYLFKFKGSNFSFNLKKDLSEIKKQLNGKKDAQSEHWLQPDHPAYEYLFGIPKPPPYETLYLGAFLTDPPTNSQLKVLKHAQLAPVTAVQGPPGSGKTTLILHLIAQQVVNRALSLIETGRDINNLTVVSSTNNRAVDNVIERLNKELAKLDEELSNQFLYLSGGKRKVIDSAGGAREQLQSAIDFLQNPKDSNFNEAQYESLKLEIKQIKQNLIEQERQYQEKRKQRQADQARLPEARREIWEVQRNLVNIGRVKARLENKLAILFRFKDLPETPYREIQLQFNRAQRKLPGRTPYWSIHWIDKLLGRTEQQIFSEMQRQCQVWVAQTKGTPFEIQLPSDRLTLARQIKRVKAGLWLFQALQTVQTSLWQCYQDTVAISREYEERQRESREILDRLTIPLTDFYSTFYQEFHEQHQDLFILSRQFLLQEALKQKKDVKDALETYLKALPGGTRQVRSINPDKLFKSLSLVFPVITCTLLSVRNMLPWLEEEYVDRAIVDESGMIPLHQTFPLLVRSRKAIIVGDPLQIEPIVNQTQETLERYLQEFFIHGGLTQEEYYRYSPDATETATTYHRAAGATGENNDVGQGIQLLEHYRCQPNIIAYCNHIAKYGLSCETPLKDSLIGSHLVAYHVDGKITENVNQKEIEAIHDIIQHLIKHGYSAKDIGVISFFRAQANALKESLIKQFAELEGAIGTVHTFQGSERQVIILSTKVCRPQDSIDWINRRPNLLNVAVSRAKELFILVGNLHQLEERGYTRQLVEHIRERGMILEYKTDAETDLNRLPQSNNPPIYDCKHIDILKEALQEVREELIVVTPRIEGDAAREFNREITSVLKRGVKVTVVYGSPDNTNLPEGEPRTQVEREIKTIFEKHFNASLIRARDEGTNQRILICDTKFAVVGSWSWLSHVYLTTCEKELTTEEAQIRREISVRLSEPASIQEIREMIDELR